MMVPHINWNLKKLFSKYVSNPTKLNKGEGMWHQAKTRRFDFVTESKYEKLYDINLRIFVSLLGNIEESPIRKHEIFQRRNPSQNGIIFSAKWVVKTQKQILSFLIGSQSTWY